MMTLDDKLYLVRYNTDHQNHIKIRKNDVCLKCEGRPCTRICPAHVYDWNLEDNRVAVGYENCVECGTCRVGCPYENIDWEYPRGGFGVSWKNG